MRSQLHTANAQRGIGLISLVGYVSAVLFIVIALNYRINVTGITANGDLVFRLIMLVYFAIVTYKLVPVLSQQQWVIDVMEKDKGPHEDKIEYVMLFFVVLFSALMTGSLIVGTAAAPSRTGSGGDYNSLAQPGEFWFAILATYILLLFLSSAYWYLRQRRLSD